MHLPKIPVPLADVARDHNSLASWETFGLQADIVPFYQVPSALHDPDSSPPVSQSVQRALLIWSCEGEVFQMRRSTARSSDRTPNFERLPENFLLGQTRLMASKPWTHGRCISVRCCCAQPTGLVHLKSSNRLAGLVRIEASPKVQP
jgi:hypothetical protein